MQGEIGNAKGAPYLIALGSMYFEPLWVVYRAHAMLDRLTQLKDKRIAIGPTGSGTRRIAANLLTANGMPIPSGKSAEITGDAAVPVLRAHINLARARIGKHSSPQPA